MKTEEAPKTEPTEGTGGQKATVTTHPAYGTIHLVRTSGYTRLFASEFRHQNYVTLRIAPAKVQRQLCKDWVYSGAPMIEVSMSEHQFARCIASIGVGEGTPCTLQRISGKSVPAIQATPNQSHQVHVAEMMEHMEEVHARLAELEDEIENGKMTKTLRTRLTRMVDSVKQAAGSNLKFVANSFTDHMSQRVEEAKSEIAAYAKVTGANKVPEIEHQPTELLDNND